MSNGKMKKGLFDTEKKPKNRNKDVAFAQSSSTIRNSNQGNNTSVTVGPKQRFIDETGEEESSDDEPESESDEETRFVKDETSELASEFWQLQKLIKYTKAGNQTATTVALCLLKNYQLGSRVGKIN